MDRQRDPDRHPRQQHERHVRLLPGLGGRLRRGSSKAEDLVPMEHDRKVAGHAVQMLHHGLLSVQLAAANPLPDGQRRFDARGAGQEVGFQHTLTVLSQHDLIGFPSVRIEKLQHPVLPVPACGVIKRGHLAGKGQRRRELCRL